MKDLVDVVKIEKGMLKIRSVYMKIRKVMMVVVGLLFLSLNSYSEGIEKYRKDISLDSLIKEIQQRLDMSGIENPGKKVVPDNYLKSDPRFYVKITAGDKYQRTRLLELGMDIISIKDGYVEGFIHRDLLKNIDAKEFTIIDKKAMYDLVLSNKDFPAQDAIYHNYKETYDVLKQIADKNQDVASLFSIGKSFEGRDIWCLRINPDEKNNTSSKKPGVLIVGNHHSREHLTNEMVLLFAVYLLENKNNPDIQKYINKLDIYIIPMLNPDGVEYDIATGKYRWWRKNTNTLNTNSVVGVDLNRNYDFNWCKQGASSSPNSDTYCGKSAFSEPETKVLRDFMIKNKNIKTAISYHSYGSLVLYPWGGKDSPVEDEKDRNAFIKHANEMAKILGYTAQQSSDLYIATGDMADWAYDKLKVLAWTIELEGNSFYPGSSIIQPAFERNKKACLYLLSITENPYN